MYRRSMPASLPRQTVAGRASKEEYCAYTDEKGNGQERYWGIGVVSGHASVLTEVRRDLAAALDSLKSL